MEQNKYFFIKGDVSGIQEYIFNVASKRAAKTLHEHSFNIMKMEEKYKGKLIKELKLSNGNQVFKGGGGFHAIIENEVDGNFEQHLNNFQLKINTELQHSSVSVRLSYGSGDKFQIAWKNLQKNNNEKRYRLYENIDESLFNELFTPFNKEDVSFFEKNLESNPEVVENQPWTKELLASIDEKKLNEEEKKVYEDIKKGLKIDAPLIDFDGYALLAEARTGTDFLGVLKMDVDNLGELFGKCDSIDKFKDKSSFFNQFFGKENIEELLGKPFEGNCYHNNIYTVYTGGDDCFFIGAWDAILSFAQIIHSKFESQVEEKFGKNSITLSSGIVLLNAKTLVVQLGKMAEDALSKAKSRKVEEKTVKNAVCLMNEIFTWEDYKGILEQTEILTDFLKDKKIARGLLEKIKKSSIGFDRLQQRIKKGEPLPFDRVYKLKYYLRDVKKEYAEEVENAIFKNYIEALTNALKLTKENLYSKDFTNPMRFPMAARLTEFKTRNFKY